MSGARRCLIAALACCEFAAGAKGQIVRLDRVAGPAIWQSHSFDLILSGSTNGTTAQSMQVVLLYDPAVVTLDSVTALGAIPQSSVQYPYNFSVNGAGVTAVRWVGAFPGPEAPVVGNVVQFSFTWTGFPTATTLELSNVRFATGLAPDQETVFIHNGIPTVPIFDIGQGSLCYANCDGSFNSMSLNANDFQCYLNAFADGMSRPVSERIAHYANCDGSTAAPVLTANDFMCFMIAYAGGCG
jgi:hypothetical protein